MRGFTFIMLCIVLACASAEGSAFGRFGRLNDDGLLTLNVTPGGFRTPPTAPPLLARFGDGTAKAVVVSINTTEKVLRLSGGGIGAPTHLRYTLLFPGMSAVFGRRMEMRFTAGADAKPEKLTVARVPDVDRYCLLVAPAESEGIAFYISFPRGFKPTRSNLVMDVNYGYTLTLESDKPIGEVRFITPFGLTATDDVHPMRAVRVWVDLPVPKLEKTEHKLSADGRSVTITYRFSADGECIAPIPPILNFAISNGYPARIHGGYVKTQCVTKWGGYTYVKGNTLTYTLPVPPTEERGYVRVPGQENRTALLNSLVGHLGGAWCKNAVDLGYAGMANAQMAGVYLSDTNKQSLAEAWRVHLPSAFRLPPYTKYDVKRPWKIACEPLTQEPYLWTYFIDGPGPYKYDIDWGNALPLYGLYKYAQYSGDWGFVRAHWNDVRRIYRYFDLGDDLAWMTVVNADHGYSTGTGDPMSAAYCGTLACLKMARVLGDKEAEKHFAYRAARAAVPTVSRLWYTSWARKHGLIGPKSVVLGFNEIEGFTRARLGVDDPWDTTNVLSGDGVLPELFDAFTALSGKALIDYENEYAQHFPEWDCGEARYPFNTTYNGNSVYVTFPHIYARAMLGEPTEKLWGYVDRAEGNRNNAWIGPNVVAELLSRDAPMVLTEWQPAEYIDGYTAQDGKTILLFKLSQPMNWTLTARLNGRNPSAVTVNGKTVQFTAESGKLTVRTRVDGLVRLEITFP